LLVVLHLFLFSVQHAHFALDIFAFVHLQWKDGDAEPASWMAHYQQNPCVPIDYSSVQAALQLAAPVTTTTSRKNRHQLQQVRSLKIWMRPGRYHLQQAIQVQAPPGVELVIETMQLPANIFQKPPPIHHHQEAMMEQVAEQPLQQQRTQPRRSASNAFLQLIRCGRGARFNPATAAFEEAEATERSETRDAAADDVLEVFGRDHHPDSHPLHHQCAAAAQQQQQQQTHATLVLQTRRHNEPAVCVRQGKVTLTNLEIQHFAHGLDIWNGNAAIQVQPPPSSNTNDLQPPRVVEPRPTAILQGCQVTSSSGRGIVNIDGGHVTIRQCAIYNCAATGVYIGGPGSEAVLQDSDVFRNGVGNHRTTGSAGSSRRGGAAAGRGIARGHSGVYLEQGSAQIRNCNISENTLTGISAVSPDNAILHLSDTSLIANGTFQLELPSIGSNARDQSRIENNQLSSSTSQAAGGSGSAGRSGLLPASAAASITTTSATANEPVVATFRG
jgi:Right handed beta helix region